VRSYLRRFSRELGREVREVAPEALERLRRHTWPGNIRELQSVLKQALLQASGTSLHPAFLPPLPSESCGPDSAAQPVADEPELEAFIRRCVGCDRGELYAETHRRVDRLLLTRVLEATRGNQHQAARRLGIARETLRRRLRELGLHFSRQLEADEDPES
jgi:two-component system nitrogen regulation response regulator GlnG